MLNLEDKEWEDFSISGNNGIFKNYHGKRLVKEKRVIGKIPLLTAGEQNNGVSDFISNNNMDSFNNCISIDMFGNSFYHNYNCFGDDNIYFFLTDSLSKYTKLFIIELINKNKSKFSYGKQFRQKNADTLKVILPINKNKEPDFEYMEKYSKSIINSKTEKYKQYAQKVLNSIEYKNIETLENKEWKEFFISGENGLFSITSTSSGIDKNKLIFSDNGKIPYITRSDLNNGINLYLENNQIPKYKIDNGNVITIGLDTQTVFYQPYSFFTGQNIQILRHNKLNKYNSLFLIPLIKIQMQKFNWGGNGATLGRLSKTKIMLPVNEKKEPDFEYMEQYMKNLTHNKIKQYLDYLKKQ